MRCRKLAVVLGLALVSTTLARSETKLKLPGGPGALGGIVMSADDKTLIVSAPGSGVLIYFDTVAEKELKRVEVDFQPAALAIQGKQLFVAAKGTAIIHVLDVETGKEVKELKLKGDPVTKLACHPSKGLLYAVNAGDAIFSIDPTKGKVVPTKAKGQMVFMDAADGKYLYTGIQKPSKDVLVIKAGPGKTTEVSLARANRFALMLKYAVKDADLELVAANDHAAINGTDMAVSPDGKRVAMVGAGGWAPATDETQRTYSIAVFDTDDMKTMLGQVEVGANPLRVAFHPHLNLGAAGRSGSPSEVALFNAKSCAKKGEPLPIAGGATPMFMTFGAQGTKVLFISMPVQGKESTLHIHPLPLTNADRETLKKVYKD